MRPRFSIPIGKDRRLDVGQRTAIVGVLNVTPDSFSDGGQYSDPAAAIDRAFQIQADGADIVEIGGESTRPRAKPVDAAIELFRIEPVLRGLAGKLRIPIAIDTYKSQVARVAVDLGATIINDVSALRFDPRIAEIAAVTHSALVLMHMRGNPAIMQDIEPSPDILAEIECDLTRAAGQALAAGINRESIVLDPGIGFGKTLDQNLEIINNLNQFSALGYPVMVGTSRKGFIGKLTGRPEDQREFGTAATVAATILRGAHLVRVHDVRAMVDVVRVADAIASDVGQASSLSPDCRS